MHLQGTGGEKKLNMHYKILDHDTLEISNRKEKEKWMMTNKRWQINGRVKTGHALNIDLKWTIMPM